MLKYSGNFYEFAEMDRDKLLNSIMFADDATIVVSGNTHFEVQLRAQQLLDVIAKFADFADTELNTGKSFATGYDFSHRRELEISLRYLGNIIPLKPSTHTFRCLGIRFNCKLEGSQGKQEVLRRTEELVSLLNNHIHDPDQIDMVMRIAIIPIFRFSAPFLGWTDRELNALHKLWIRGFKAAYRLPKSTANALISLPRSHGGLNCSHPSVYLRKECIKAITQMLEINDHYCKIYIYRTKRELLDLGAISIREAQEDLFLAHTPTTRYTNPFFHLLYLARRANWTLQWKVFEFDRPAGRRSLVGLSLPMRRELLHLTGQDARKKQLSKWRLAVQRLAAAGLWCEEDILFSNQRQIDWERIAEILHTDQEASDFADILSQIGTFYWFPPEEMLRHDVPTKGLDENGNFCVLLLLYITFLSLTSLLRPSLKLCRPSEYAVLSSSELPDSSSVSDDEPTL